MLELDQPETQNRSRQPHSLNRTQASRVVTMDTLVIEHRKSHQHSLKVLIEESGHRAWVAPTGKLAREYLNRSIDLGIIDTGLPGSPGPLNLVRELKLGHEDCEIILIGRELPEADLHLLEEMGALCLFREPLDYRSFRLCLRMIDRLHLLKEGIGSLQHLLGGVTGGGSEVGSSLHLVDDLWLEIFSRLKNDPKQTV